MSTIYWLVISFIGSISLPVSFYFCFPLKNKIKELVESHDEKPKNAHHTNLVRTASLLPLSTRVGTQRARYGRQKRWVTCPHLPSQALCIPKQGTRREKEERIECKTQNIQNPPAASTHLCYCVGSYRTANTPLPSTRVVPSGGVLFFLSPVSGTARLPVCT